MRVAARHAFLLPLQPVHGFRRVALLPFRTAPGSLGARRVRFLAELLDVLLALHHSGCAQVMQERRDARSELREAGQADGQARRPESVYLTVVLAPAL